jgi:chromosome partitioning protein
MTRIISVANQKGGCAKTTTSVNLCAALFEAGKKVLLIDLDPQANASQWVGADLDNEGVFELFTTITELKKLIQTSESAGFDVIAGSRNLSTLEKALAGEMSVETKLKRSLLCLSEEHYDYVIIDTPPTLGLITLNALCASSLVLITVTTHVMTLSGVAQLIQTLNEVKETQNPELSILGLLACRVDLRTRHSADVLDALTQRFGSQVLRTRIRENIRLAEAPSFQQSILRYRSTSGAAEDFRALAKEILKRTKDI